MRLLAVVRAARHGEFLSRTAVLTDRSADVEKVSQPVPREALLRCVPRATAQIGGERNIAGSLALCWALPGELARRSARTVGLRGGSAVNQNCPSCGRVRSALSLIRPCCLVGLARAPPIALRRQPGWWVPDMHERWGCAMHRSSEACHRGTPGANCCPDSARYGAWDSSFPTAGNEDGPRLPRKRGDQCQSPRSEVRFCRPISRLNSPRVFGV